MTLRIHFARLRRKFLTPIRQIMILRRIKSRVKDISVIKDNTFSLTFTHTKKEKQTGKFGIVVALTQRGFQTGCVLRCVYTGIGRNLICEAYDEHKNITTHGVLIEQQRPSNLNGQYTPPNKNRNSDPTDIQDILNKMNSITADMCSGYYSPSNYTSTTITQPQRVVRKKRVTRSK